MQPQYDNGVSSHEWWRRSRTDRGAAAARERFARGHVCGIVSATMTQCRVSAASIVAVLGLCAPVQASDRVTYPYPGVAHVHRVVSGLDAHVVTVDLAASVDVVATRPHDRWATVSTWARENRAQIAINANFFAGSVCGLAMGNGHVWHDSYTEQCDATMAFGRNAAGWRSAVIDSAGWARGNPLPWAEEIVSGMPILLRGGYTFFDEHEPNGMYRRHPRTALGLAGDGTTLILVEIEGRRAGIPGVTSLDMIPLLEEFGARDAINLDGGGSSALWIEAEGGIVNRPSDGHERTVMNHLGIRLAGVPY